MSEKRKDGKGRILRTGESQRSDGRYQYRYKEIYDWHLHALLEKEKEIQKQLSEGVSFFDGNIPLCELIDRAYALKRNWAESTKSTMNRYLKFVKTSQLYRMPINIIKKADVKAFSLASMMPIMPLER